MGTVAVNNDPEIARLFTEFEAIDRELLELEPDRIRLGELAWLERQLRAEHRAAPDELFDAAGLTEIEARADELGRRARSILDRIVATPAHTTAGVRLKARAIQRLYRGDRIDFGNDSSEFNLARSIVVDLLAIAA